MLGTRALPPGWTSSGSFTSEDIRGGADLLDAQPVVGGQQGFQLLGSRHILADLREALWSPSACAATTRVGLSLRGSRSGNVPRLTLCLRASLRSRSISSAGQDKAKLGLIL